MSDDTAAVEAWTVQRHLEGKPEQSVAMFHRFVEFVGWIAEAYAVGGGAHLR